MKNFMKVVVLFTIMTLSGSCLAQCSVRCAAAFKFVVSHEDRNLTGFIAKEPRGGYARFGVNSRAHPEMIKLGFYSYRMGKIRAYNYAQAIFYKGYWKTIHGDDIKDDRLAFRMADLAYNLGPIRATILLQRALNKQISRQVSYLYEKGYFGDDTLFWTNQLPAVNTNVLVKNEARSFYRRLAEKYPVMRTWKGIWYDRLAEPEKTSVALPDWLEVAINTQPELPVLARGN